MYRKSITVDFTLLGTCGRGGTAYRYGALYAEPYPPDTLYSICTGLLRFIKERRPKINIFNDPQYAGFQKTLDAEMKRLRSMGVGVKKRQAEPIFIQEDNILWERDAWVNRIHTHYLTPCSFFVVSTLHFVAEKSTAVFVFLSLKSSMMRMDLSV